MKAIVLEKFGDTSSFVEKEVPTPQVSRSEVRIKIHTTGFNPVDYKIRKGLFGGTAPAILGAECSGVVDAVGDSVHELSVGDEVYTFAMGPISNGTYAEYITLPVQFVAKKPKNLSFATAAAIPLTYLTAFNSLIATNALQKDRPFFLAGGSGGVGTAAIALAKAYGAGPIFTLSGSKNSFDYLTEELGILKEHILNYTGLTNSQMAEKLIKMNDNNRFYLTYDCVGGSLKELCFDLCEIGGHLVTILTEDQSTPIFDRQSMAFSKSLSIHVKFLGAAALSDSPQDWMAYRAQLNHLTDLFKKEGLEPPKTQVVGPFSADTVKKAHLQLEKGHTQGKLIMTI